MYQQFHKKNAEEDKWSGEKQSFPSSSRRASLRDNDTASRRSCENIEIDMEIIINLSAGWTTFIFGPAYVFTTFPPVKSCRKARNYLPALKSAAEDEDSKAKQASVQRNLQKSISNMQSHLWNEAERIKHLSTFIETWRRILSWRFHSQSLPPKEGL